MARVDILLRLFNVWDVTMNPGNYGYVTVNREIETWSTIDFRVDTQKHYVSETMFEDFCRGQGMEGYLGLPAYVLKDILPEERVKLAEEVLREFTIGSTFYQTVRRKMPLLEAMINAFRDVIEYMLLHHKVLQCDLEKIMADFQAYFEAVQTNFTLFASKLMGAQLQTANALAY